MIVGDEELQVLTICDQDLRKITLVTIGQKSACIQKMREISEVLHVAGDKAQQDLSETLTGYPTINHERVNLQVIPVGEYVQGEDACREIGFAATGAHLEGLEGR